MKMHIGVSSQPTILGDREDHFLRIGQVLDAAGQEGLGHGDRIQRLPQQLDLAVFGHETASKLVMDGAPGRPRRRLGHVSANTCSGVSIRTWVSSSDGSKSIPCPSRGYVTRTDLSDRSGRRV